MITALATRPQVDRQTVSQHAAPFPAPEALPLTVQQVLGQVSLIQQIMAAAMKDGEHYGKIPGCGDEPTLLKPGAEKLCLTFRLAPQYDVLERQLDGGHREYRVTTTLVSILSGTNIGQGVGSCSSLEGKYRFRGGAAEPTDRPVPRAYWDLRQEDSAKAQELIGGKGFTTKKVEGNWMIAKGGEKVEHDNPADHHNTVLKMAKKRALVDAVLTATAASDIFTQDLEDVRANLELATAAALPAVAAAPAQTAPPAPAPLPVQEANVTVEEEPLDFRSVEVPFGKNQGLSLALLTAEQIAWYEDDWMPRNEGKPGLSGEERLLIRALKAQRAWRQAEQPQAAATATQS